MKRFVLCNLAILLAVGAGAQGLRLYQGSVCYAVSAAEAGTMTYSGEEGLVIGSHTFSIAEIDSIVTSADEPAVDTICVTYLSDRAMVELPYCAWDVVTATVSGADVVLVSTADSTLNELTYRLTGESESGSFTQDGSYKCGLVLDDLTLTSTSGAAIDIDNGKRIEVRIPDGTTTTLADYALGEQKACFRIKGHAEFRGGGTLNITGNCSHAYKSGEYTEIKASFGTLNIFSSANDGMHVGQYFLQNGGTLNIGAEDSGYTVAGDALQVEANLEGEELDGQAFLNGGVINIYNETYRGSGIQVDSTLWITGGEINITTTGLAGRCIEVYSADITNSNSDPVLTLYAEGGTTTVDDDTKKSACLKTDGDFYFHAGTIWAYPTGEKANGVKVGGNYYRTSAAVINVTPKVDGAIYTISE